MWPALLLGAGLSVFINRTLNEPDRAPNGEPIPPIDRHMDPATRAGLGRLLAGGTPDDLDQGARSLLYSGYPLAAHICAQRSIHMRQYLADRRAALARHQQLTEAQNAQAAEVLRLQEGAQIAAEASKLARVPPMAGQAPGPQPVPTQAGPQDVVTGGPSNPPTGGDPVPAVSSAAPPAAGGTGRRKAPRKVKADPVVVGDEVPPAVEQQINGRAQAEH